MTIRRRILLCGVAAGISLFMLWRLGRPSADQLARAAQKALRDGHSGEARELARRAVALAPRSSLARLAAAEVDFEAGRLEDALGHLETVKDDGTTAALTAANLAGESLFRLNRLCEAQKRFRRVLEIDSHHLKARQRLAIVLAISGRREASRLYFEMVKEGRFGIRELSLLGDPEQVYDNPDYKKFFDEPVSSDVCVSLGAARYALYRQDSSKAAGLYRKLAVSHPHDVDVLAGLGCALVDAGTTREFLRWHARLPLVAEEHPQIWDVRGRFAQKRAEYETAIRCYGEALRRDPSQIHANYQLAVLLHQRGDADHARAFQQRAERLAALVEIMGPILRGEKRTDLWLKAARLTEALGRHWEAWGWYRMAVERSQQQELRSQVARLAESLDADTPQTLPQANPATEFDFSSFPLPSWSERGQGTAAEASSRGSPWIGQVKFADEARDAGVNFTYCNGHASDVVGMRIFEGFGGGVAALDYDGDLWPDLYFTQGCEWPPRPGQTQHLDRLFRNLGNGRFADVTAASGLGDERYSQGVAAGDVDDDGFPDLYVANIGKNRLYRNNGDGTFTDATERARLEGAGWTTSALIADLNADGLPEIYDVTYLAGRAPLEQICYDKVAPQIPAVCSPKGFAAEQDRLYLNRGDGTFEDISARSGILAPDGKGLGIVAGDFDGSGRISLYVANDTTDNFLFVNQPARAKDLPTFVEQGKLSGCAVNGEGKPQASMGIAVDDADGDGRLDLFITNFYDEYDVLYRQLPGGLFEDVSGPARLKEPTLHMLGFGTQFLDADLDGWPDLVVANGHIDDFRRNGTPFRMRAQFFANTGEGRFTELPPAQLGDYFQTEQLGRGLARLDWNRDGREDFAVSNLDTPAALVTNRTSDTGHFLALQLRGVESNRDAIGTILVAAVGGRKLFKQLTAGDGYQASNQRQLVFGLGEYRIADELLVRWPSGREQKFSQVTGDIAYLLVEGRPELLRLPAP